MKLLIRNPPQTQAGKTIKIGNPMHKTKTATLVVVVLSLASLLVAQQPPSTPAKTAASGPESFLDSSDEALGAIAAAAAAITPGLEFHAKMPPSRQPGRGLLPWCAMDEGVLA